MTTLAALSKKTPEYQEGVFAHTKTERLLNLLGIQRDLITMQAEEIERLSAESKEQGKEIKRLRAENKNPLCQLTGLHQRCYLEEIAEHALLGIERRVTAHDRDQAEESPHVALIFIDMNGFKTVNDQYGHNYGDQVLCGIAQALRATLRTEDVITRVGGDEFVVFCQGDGIEGVEFTKQKILDGVKKYADNLPDELGFLRKFYAISLGSATTEQGHQTFDALYQAADEKLRLEKERFYLESGIKRRGHSQIQGE